MSAPVSIGTANPVTRDTIIGKSREMQLQAAKLPGISRLTLREKLAEYGLRPEPAPGN